MRGLLDVDLLLSSFQIAHQRISHDIAMLFCGPCNWHNFIRPKRRGLQGYECQNQWIGLISVPFPTQFDGIMRSKPMFDTKLNSIARLLGLLYVLLYYMNLHRKPTQYWAMDLNVLFVTYSIITPHPRPLTLLVCRF